MKKITIVNIAICLALSFLFLLNMEIYDIISSFVHEYDSKYKFIFVGNSIIMLALILTIFMLNFRRHDNKKFGLYTFFIFLFFGVLFVAEDVIDDVYEDQIKDYVYKNSIDKIDRRYPNSTEVLTLKELLEKKDYKAIEDFEVSKLRYLNKDALEVPDELKEDKDVLSLINRILIDGHISEDEANQFENLKNNKLK